MYFKLLGSQEDELLSQPETGMGYQIVEARRKGSYTHEKFLVLNSEIVIERNTYEPDYVRKIVSEGLNAIKASAEYIILSEIRVLNEKQFRNILFETKGQNERGAIDNPVETADGEEIFVRLSAFENDRRVDKINRCLMPGSFTTTADDYAKCKLTQSNPVNRYALPNNDEIKYAFYFQPKRIDTLQRGIVQPANGHQGGGKEVYFANGTCHGTFLKQTPY